MCNILTIRPVGKIGRYTVQYSGAIISIAALIAKSRSNFHTHFIKINDYHLLAHILSITIHALTLYRTRINGQNHKETFLLILYIIYCLQ